jgi:hypothetical protein
MGNHMLNDMCVVVLSRQVLDTADFLVGVQIQSFLGTTIKGTIGCTPKIPTFVSRYRTPF